jgi:hypothetical protein
VKQPVARSVVAISRTRCEREELRDAFPFARLCCFNDVEKILEDCTDVGLVIDHEQPWHAKLGAHSLVCVPGHRAPVVGEEDAIFPGGPVKYLRVGRLSKADVLYTNDVQILALARELSNKRTMEVVVTSELELHLTHT